MKKHLNDEVDTSGQDAFLDIVANMVGILILLVLVMGLRASQAVTDAAGDDDSAAELAEQQVTDDDLREAARTAAASQAELQELVQRALLVRRESLLRDEERNLLNTVVAAAEDELADRRDALDVQQRRDVDLRVKIAQRQLALDKLTREQVALLSQQPETETIENQPTPLARTVRGEEIHLHLSSGRVAVVPWRELEEEREKNLPSDRSRMRGQNAIESTVGPVGGFRMRYRIEQVRYVRRENGLQEEGRSALVVKREFLPVSSKIGQPVEQAMLPGSDLWKAIRQHAPQSTTVTVWTYPDSFSSFRRIQGPVYDAGYSTACRPLPEGLLITASIHGSRTLAQ